MDDAIQKLENYLENVSTEELAENLDYVLKTQFYTINPDFKSFYEKEINRLRTKDALHQQVNYLKKHKSQIKKYNKDMKKYTFLFEHQGDIQKMYTEWKEKNKSRIIHLDMDEFYLSEENNIRSLFKKEEQEYISPETVKKMIRNAHKTTKEKYRLTAPKSPDTAQIENFNEMVDLTFSQKTSAELLAEIEKARLCILAYAIINALDSNTDILEVLISFLFAHQCQATTKGKEYKRTDRQKEPDISKTKGKSYSKYYEDYLNLLKELNIKTE